MTSVYTLIIPNTTRTHVWLAGPEPVWTLPELEFEQPPYWQVVSPLNDAVRERFGFSVTTLRCRSNRYDSPTAHPRRVYELDVDGTPHRGHAHGSWRRIDAVADLPREQRLLVAAWFEDAGAPAVPAGRVPWYRPAWRDPMRVWLRRALNHVGRTPTGAIEQLRSWERASLWRVATTSGMVYFKAVPAMFGHEPALTTLLADQFPTLIPPVLTVDVARRWFVLAEAGGQPLMHVPTIEHWEDALRAYAQMQIALSHQTDALHTVGVPVRSLAWLRAGMEQLLADTGTLGQGPTGLSTQERDALQARVPALQAAIATLEQSGLPLSLEHGDFSAWQVQVDGDAVQFLDWSDSSVAPPFFSLLGVLGDSPSGLPGVPDAAARLRDSYLSPWTALAGMEELQQLFAMAQRLAPLHHALIYYRDILPAMEHRWEMEQMLPYYVRLLL